MPEVEHEDEDDCTHWQGVEQVIVLEAWRIAANTYVVSGHAETKKLQDLLPGIINQLGPDNLANLKKLAETYLDGDVVVLVVSKWCEHLKY